MSGKGIFVDPRSRTLTVKPPSALSKNQPLETIFLGEVVDIAYTGKRAGCIVFRSGRADSNVSLDKINNVAQPLLSNFKMYPLKGELVLIFSFGNTYYLPLNFLNNPNINQTTTAFSRTLTDQKVDYSKLTPTTFNLKSKSIYITPSYEGDIVVEGRFGQSLKFGSTIKYEDKPVTNYSKSDLSEPGDPITIIRNGSKSTEENIILDDSSIYLCSTQKILIDNNSNGFDGITADWSTININAVSQVSETIQNVSANSPDSSRPGNPIPADPDNQSNSIPNTTTPVLNNPDYMQQTNAGITAVTTGSADFQRPGDMTISRDGLKALIRAEGARYVVYDDSNGKPIASYAEAQGYPTIGVGHLIKTNERDKFAPFLKGVGQMDDNQVQKLLMEDLGPRIRALNNMLKVEVTQDHFDALLSMMFNTGAGNRFFKRAIELTNQKKYDEAAQTIRSGPTTSKGKVFPGLVRRRNNEADEYLGLT